MNMREPSAFHARSDTLTICDGTIVFARSAPNTRYAVMSLVSDAGSRRSSAAAPRERLPAGHVDELPRGGGDRGAGTAPGTVVVAGVAGVTGAGADGAARFAAATGSGAAASSAQRTVTSVRRDMEDARKRTIIRTPSEAHRPPGVPRTRHYQGLSGR